MLKSPLKLPNRYPGPHPEPRVKRAPQGGRRQGTRTRSAAESIDDIFNFTFRGTVTCFALLYALLASDSATFCSFACSPKRVRPSTLQRAGAIQHFARSQAALQTAATRAPRPSLAFVPQFRQRARSLTPVRHRRDSLGDDSWEHAGDWSACSSSHLDDTSQILRDIHERSKTRRGKSRRFGARSRNKGRCSRQVQPHRPDEL